MLELHHMFMKKQFQYWVCLSLITIFSFQSHAQTAQTIEEIINTYIYAYELSPANRFRLAAYAEMKAKTSPDQRSILIEFGDLGTLTLYPNNCLLRTFDYQVFHLNLDKPSPPSAYAFNQQLNHIFESILLMSNDEAAPEKIYFIDEYLARKNIEPFEKIYLRHILIRYGKFHSEKQYVELHTDWLPKRIYQYRKPGESHIVNHKTTPLGIRLDEKILRGYYINAGGTVYVEDLDNVEFFATGETYDYNVAAFKLFLQKLFVQSVQYIMKKESNRTYHHVLQSQEIQQLEEKEQQAFPVVASQSSQPPMILKKQDVTDISTGSPTSQIAPLYSPHAWMPMMLGMLRANGVNIGDADIIRYFVDEPYFQQLYELMLPEEQRKVDLYQRRVAPRS